MFGTLYRRISRSNSSQSMFGVQSLCILLAGKSSLEDNSNDNDILIRAKDLGGCWTVTPEVFKIFLHVESKFRTEQCFLALQKIFNEISTERKLSLTTKKCIKQLQ